MKFVLTSLSLLIVSSTELTWAYDWEEEELGREKVVQVNKVRSYPGGADEQELKVQTTLPNPSRSPEGAPEMTKRSDAEPDDHSDTE